MRFSKFASSLLTFALLGTSTLAELTKVPRSSIRSQGLGLSARDDGQDLLEKLAQQCEEAGENAKRSVDLRTRDPVDMGTDESGPLGTELKTIGLGPCQGIAVSGKYEDENAEGDAVFLAHVSATKMETVGALVGKVKAAKEAGLKDLKAVLVLLDPDSYPEEEATLAELLSKLNQLAVDTVTDIGDIEVTEKPHDYEKIASLEIKSDGSIEADT